MYKVEARAVDGFSAIHRAWTMAEALEWMKQYPAHVADMVLIRRFGRVVRVRVA